MSKEILWDKFVKSGKIDDYLKYIYKDTQYDHTGRNCLERACVWRV